MTADQLNTPVHWIQFLRQYGPLPSNENQYDEHILKAARRLRVDPLCFEHPAQSEVIAAITKGSPCSVVLTGTAGDGKTHLCRQIWEHLSGDAGAWASKSPYLSTPLPVISPNADVGPRNLHVIRDLSAFVPHRGQEWASDRAQLLDRFSKAVFRPSEEPDVFLIAANDGQLTEAWSTLPDGHERVVQMRMLLEELLVEDQQSKDGIPLRLFNLSRWSSSELLNRALDALLNHPGWTACGSLNAGSGEFFGSACPIRENYRRLREPLMQARLKALLMLCDYCGSHIPIRQILLLLSNAILGHPDVRDRLMTAADVPVLIRDCKIFGANVYRNLFGGNLRESRREGTLIFSAFERFGIGQETANRIDNLLIFGSEEDVLRPYYDRYLAADLFYGATSAFRADQREYVEGGDEDGERNAAFLAQLTAQRQGLFFKISEADLNDLRLWELTVFHYAGEYLARVVEPLGSKRPVDRGILARLVRGLNRVFTGRLVTDDREFLLATDAKASFGRVSQLLEDKISVAVRGEERVDLVSRGRLPVLRVQLARDMHEELALHLTRYEFLVRVADGALPNSFSKECYEDMLAFKSRLLRSLMARRERDGDGYASELFFQMLDVDETGRARVTPLEVMDA
ncbi:MAG: hypothetical protein HY791_15920 [Deltaproteobacteria bacterium]|nr:hypothetical protein [Deltaproteobacteria bacterium]